MSARIRNLIGWSLFAVYGGIALLGHGGLHAVQDVGHGHSHGPQIAARAPRVNAAAFVMGFDELEGAVAFEVTRVQQRRVSGIGVVLRVQAHIAHRVVRPAVAIEIRGRDRRPPAGASGGKAGQALETKPVSVAQPPGSGPDDRT